MTALATIIDGRIAVKTKGGNFDSNLLRCKAVLGGRFSKPDRTWRYPLAVDTCHALRRVWGDDLEVRPLLADWYRKAAQEAAQQTQRASLTDATLTRLPQVAPRLAATLRPDQRVGAAWVAATHRGAGLVADKPGLGKTIETIAGLLEAGLDGPILVVCPKLSVKPVWFREWSRWTDVPVFMARGTRAHRQKAIAAFEECPDSLKVLVIVAEMLRVERKPLEDGDPKSAAKKRGRVLGYSFPELFQTPWTAIVADESQRLFGSMTVAKSTLAGEGLAQLAKANPTARRYAISATPFGKGGRVQGMFGTLHWLWPDEYTSYWRWVDTHFETEEEYIGKGKTAKKIVGLRGGKSEAEFLASLGPRILRRTKEEVLKNLPPKQYVDVMCELTTGQVKQYRQLDLDAEIGTPGGVIGVNGVLALITRSRQVANGVLTVVDGKVKYTGESGKLDMMEQYLDQWGILDGSSDEKVLIASQYNEFLEQAIARVAAQGVPYHVLVGSTSDRERDRIMEEFMSDGGPRLFFLNSKAGGVSITLDSADKVFCLDEMDNPEDNEQLEDRVHRASRMHQVTIYYFRSEGTIDETKASDVEWKRQTQFKVLDGRRGQEYIRSVVKYRKPKESE